MGKIKELEQRIEMMEFRERARKCKTAQELYNLYAPRLLRILDEGTINLEKLKNKTNDIDINS